MHNFNYKKANEVIYNTVTEEWSEVKWLSYVRLFVTRGPLSSSIHGILQARIREWVAISFSRGSSWPRDQTQVSRIAGRHFNLCATREAITEMVYK